ncbi:MAG TPA: prolyl oligopeptidase family serine peptidase, partial [Gemmatimonadaceae bacterium]|nr:prolyl oligopeptidase family serine peptidase [Gemmatimonadaceae bacterium]
RGVMRVPSCLWWRASLLLQVVIAAAMPAQSSGKRPYTVDDLLSVEGIESVAPSPDGELIAIAVHRGRGPGEIYQRQWIDKELRSDIWLVRPDGSALRRLTNGRTDGSGSWNPVWSPDGRWLAMLSTHGGETVRAFVWTRGDSMPRQVHAQPVDIMANVELGKSPFNPLSWLNDSTLLLPLLPPGQEPMFDPHALIERKSREWWELARSGSAVTSSVLDTEQRPVMYAEQLVGVVMPSGKAQLLATFPADQTTSGVRTILASPKGNAIAVVTAELMRPHPVRQLSRTMTRERLGTIRPGLDTAVAWADGFSLRKWDNWVVLLRWSTDGSKLLALGVNDDDPRGAPAVHELFASSTARTRQPVGGVIEPDVPAPGYAAPPAVWPDALWSPDGSPILLRDSGGRASWWLHERIGRPRDLTGSLTTPGVLVPGASMRTVYAVTDYAVWAIDAASGTRAKVTGIPAGRVRIAWPAGTALRRVPPNQIVLEVVADTSRLLFELDVGRERASITPIGRLSPGWSVVGYQAKRRTVLAQWRRSELAAITADSAARLLRLNTHFDDIVRPAHELIRYRSTDGDSLSAVLVLPVDYVPGRRYPMVTFVYAGSIYSDTLQARTYPDFPFFLSPLLFASRGYAVLFPSMPAPPIGGTGVDKMHLIPSGVLPAVDKAIELGVADPNRLAVMGHSYGGYSTLTLATATRQFQSAIAVSPINNLITAYGTFRPWDRIRDDAHLNMAEPKGAEAGQQQMGGHPWDYLWRYLKNSPVLYVDRVETPVMLIQGSNDHQSTLASEEFFTGLYRLGKRGRFVRYWGEGHVFESPANIRDYWRQVFAWLDETLSISERSTHTQ